MKRSTSAKSGSSFLAGMEEPAVLAVAEAEAETCPRTVLQPFSEIC